MEEVVVLKMISGEEMIARVVSENENTIVVKDALSIAPGPQGVGLIPSLFTVEEAAEVAVTKNCIAMRAAPKSEVKSKYLETVTGLTIPDKKIIMG
jgi:hypothetical protein